MDTDTLDEYLNKPYQAPPPGMNPNYSSPDSIAYQVYITAGVSLAFMIVFALFRLVSTIKITDRIYIIDEVIFVLGFLFCSAFATIGIVCVAGGPYGKHSWDVLLGDFTLPQLVLSLVVEIIAPLPICLVKTSVLLLYLHVFGVVRWMRVTLYVAMVLLVSYHLSIAISIAALCLPGTGYSQPNYFMALVSPRCLRTGVLILLQGVGSVVTDFFLLIFPLPTVWALQIRARQKMAVLSMFMVGLCACISSLIGLYYRVKYYQTTQDGLRLVIPRWTTSMAENAAGVMICCMPSAVAVIRNAKEPLQTWMSGLSEYTARLVEHLNTNRTLKIQGGSKEDADSTTVSEDDEQPIYDHPDPRNRHTARVELGRVTPDILRMNSTSGRIVRMTEITITQGS